MASAYSAYHANGKQQQTKYTLTGLGRWSGLEKSPPGTFLSLDAFCAITDPSQTQPRFAPSTSTTLITPVCAIEILFQGAIPLTSYIVFKTPLPNPALWNNQTIGLLAMQDKFINGGWWHDNNILASVGDGIHKEEPRAWEGWWNEKIVQLVQLSIRQPDAVCVLLTGRGDRKFTDIIRRMVESKGLNFDMLVLKPPIGPSNQTFDNTMHFKQAFLTELVEVYKGASELRIYEDRPKHTKAFKEFFENYNYRQSTNPTRGTIGTEVIQVPNNSTTLDPLTEVTEVQRMIQQHNEELLKQPLHLRPAKLAIKKTVFFTSYMVGQEDKNKLLALANIPADINKNSLKIHGSNIIICPKPCPKEILNKIGGMGSLMRWEVTGTACYHNSIWAACLTPAPGATSYHTESAVPHVVLAMKKGARPADAGKINTWAPLPPDQRFVFDSRVGEKMILRIEEDDPRQGDYENLYAGKGGASKRKVEEQQPAAPVIPTGPRNAGRSRGGGGGGGGGKKGRSGRNRGRGGYSNYKSLDEVKPAEVLYDQNNPPPGPAAMRKGTAKGPAAAAAADLGDYY